MDYNDEKINGCTPFCEGLEQGRKELKEYKQKVKKFIVWVEQHFGCSCQKEYEQEKKKLELN